MLSVFKNNGRMSASLSEYCNLSIQRSIKKISQQSPLERSLIIQTNELNTLTSNKLYSFLFFLSMSTMTFWFWKKNY